MFRLLWIDDEIELLRPHIMFLQERGYTVEGASNPEDGLIMLREHDYDAVLLDQMMTGKSGLQALPELRATKPDVPIVMVTQSEDESLIEEAYSHQISDYVVKPIRGSQVLAVLKRVLESRNLARSESQRAYLTEFHQFQSAISASTSIDGWCEFHLGLSKWELELVDELNADAALQTTLQELRMQANIDFAKTIETQYRDLVRDENAPLMSPHVVSQYVVPHLEKNKSVAFIVIDCLRLDQWLALEPLIRPLFDIDRQLYMGIIPSATPYARNSLFSGLFPRELEKRYPDIFTLADEDDFSANRFERELLEVQLKNFGVNLSGEVRYAKANSPDEGAQLDRRMNLYTSSQMTGLVFNFVDQVAHTRSASAIVRDMVPDEAAYRDVVRNWYRHSTLPNLLEAFAKAGTIVVITSDHGSTRGRRPTKVLADREASSGLRYKYGRNLKADRKGALLIDRPDDYMLPRRGINTTYLIAREDYFFVYPTNSNQHAAQYRDSFQHGGISLEELVLPVATLTPRKIRPS
ncbi:MAG: bifunctional response regulator/alkaline phosphatase family protein [bacterium]|nr:bifunctional response regulator/alkaline phosphatase family protein [bacterium]